jgi:hypothetical protein
MTILIFLLSQDLIKTANLLFSQLDTAYVWTVCAKHFSQACTTASSSLSPVQHVGSESTSMPEIVQPVGSGSTTIPEICALVAFLLDIVSIETYVETSSEHLPRFFHALVETVGGSVGRLSGRELSLCLATTKKGKKEVPIYR